MPEMGKNVKTLLDLTDTPDAYTGDAGKVVAIKATEDGVEFIESAAGAHDLGGASHIADTLANLNTKVSDATLDSEANRDAAIATHKGDASAHHTKYTDAEAVAAAKTVKLDDFNAPDDNTDLDASTSRHGLLPKLDGTATKYLDGSGAFSTPAGGGGPTVVRKTADETVNNSAVLQADDELFIAIGANEIWLLQFYLLQKSVSTASDINFGFIYPANCKIYWGPLGYWNGVDTSSSPATCRIESDGSNRGCANSTQVLCYIALVVNGANAGTVTLRWAQNTATAEDTKILANSCLIAHKLA